MEDRKHETAKQYKTSIEFVQVPSRDGRKHETGLHHNTSDFGLGSMQLLTDLVIGGSVGVVSKTIAAPWQHIKILVNIVPGKSGNIESYRGIGDCIRRVRAEQGVTAFWRGNLMNCLHYGPRQGFPLAFNEFLLNSAFPQYDSKSDFWKSFGVKLASGGVAGGVANTICYPFDYARTRLVSDVKKGTGQFNGIGDCIVTSVRSEGITGLYTGWSVTSAAVFVYRAGQLGCFKQIQDVNPYNKDKGYLGGISTFVAVTSARTVVMPFAYPFDTVRRRMLLQFEKPIADRLYKSSIDCFVKVMQKEGFNGMYRGMVRELFRGVGGSLVIVMYDRIKMIWGL